MSKIAAVFGDGIPGLLAAIVLKKNGMNAVIFTSEEEHWNKFFLKDTTLAAIRQAVGDPDLLEAETAPGCSLMTARTTEEVEQALCHIARSIEIPFQKMSYFNLAVTSEAEKIGENIVMVDATHADRWLVKKVNINYPNAFTFHTDHAALAIKHYCHAVVKISEDNAALFEQVVVESDVKTEIIEMVDLQNKFDWHEPVFPHAKIEVIRHLDERWLSFFGEAPSKLYGMSEQQQSDWIQTIIYIRTRKKIKFIDEPIIKFSRCDAIRVEPYSYVDKNGNITLPLGEALVDVDYANLNQQENITNCIQQIKILAESLVYNEDAKQIIFQQKTYNEKISGLVIENIKNLKDFYINREAEVFDGAFEMNDKCMDLISKCQDKSVIEKIKHFSVRLKLTVASHKKLLEALKQQKAVAQVLKEPVDPSVHQRIKSMIDLARKNYIAAFNLLPDGMVHQKSSIRYRLAQFYPTYIELNAGVDESCSNYQSITENILEMLNIAFYHSLFQKRIDHYEKLIRFVYKKGETKYAMRLIEEAFALENEAKNSGEEAMVSYSLKEINNSLNQSIEEPKMDFEHIKQQISNYVEAIKLAEEEKDIEQVIALTKELLALRLPMPPNAPLITIPSDVIGRYIDISLDKLIPKIENSSSPLTFQAEVVDLDRLLEQHGLALVLDGNLQKLLNKMNAAQDLVNLPRRTLQKVNLTKMLKQAPATPVANAKGRRLKKKIVESKKPPVSASVIPPVVKPTTEKPHKKNMPKKQPDIAQQRAKLIRKIAALHSFYQKEAEKHQENPTALLERYEDTFSGIAAHAQKYIDTGYAVETATKLKNTLAARKKDLLNGIKHFVAHINSGLSEVTQLQIRLTDETIMQADLNSLEQKLNLQDESYRKNVLLAKPALEALTQKSEMIQNKIAQLAGVVIPLAALQALQAKQAGAEQKATVDSVGNTESTEAAVSAQSAENTAQKMAAGSSEAVTEPVDAMTKMAATLECVEIANEVRPAITPTETVSGTVIEAENTKFALPAEEKPQPVGTFVAYHSKYPKPVLISTQDKKVPAKQNQSAHPKSIHTPRPMMYRALDIYEQLLELNATLVNLGDFNLQAGEDSEQVLLRGKLRYIIGKILVGYWEFAESNISKDDKKREEAHQLRQQFAHLGDTVDIADCIIIGARINTLFANFSSTARKEVEKLSVEAIVDKFPEIEKLEGLFEQKGVRVWSLEKCLTQLKMACSDINHLSKVITNQQSLNDEPERRDAIKALIWVMGNILQEINWRANVYKPQSLAEKETRQQANNLWIALKQSFQLTSEFSYTGRRKENLIRRLIKARNNEAHHSEETLDVNQLLQLIGKLLRLKLDGIEVTPLQPRVSVNPAKGKAWLAPA